MTIKKAFYVATTGRPGPVVVDIPKDITAHKTEYHYPDKIVMRSYSPVVNGHPGQIKRAVDLILDAKRPMIYTGGGVILGGASKSLTEFVRNHRLDRAKDMLAQREGSISEIAWRTGFQNAKYFSTCFKERFGTTPSSFVAG